MSLTWKEEDQGGSEVHLGSESDKVFAEVRHADPGKADWFFVYNDPAPKSHEASGYGSSGDARDAAEAYHTLMQLVD